MRLFLLSQGFVSVRENDIKVDTKIDMSNNFYNNLKNSIKEFGKLVFIANDSSLYEENDINANFLANAFKKQMTEFKNVIVLDNRNKIQAKEHLENADLIFLQGGKLDCQIDFLREIGFINIKLKENCVIVGQSAGAMNLCKTVYYYPEVDEEIRDDRFQNGLGFCDLVIIPHFNLENGNEYCLGNFNLLNDFFIPDSKGRVFFALTNGSYIIKDGYTTILFGESYILQDGKVNLYCKNGENKVIK